MQSTTPAISRLQAHLTEHDPGGVLGLYLFGSSVTGGLRPDSDIDLLLVTRRSLSPAERRGLTDLLLQHSGRRATVSPGRPLELTSLVRDEVVPWRYPPSCDYLYGEWLRDEILTGSPPEPHVNPDLAVLVTTLRQHSETLVGPEPATLLDPVPAEDLDRALRDSLGPLLEDLAGDERNVLLTLARMVVTLESGEIVPKDEAAAQLLPDLPAAHRPVLELARQGYRGDTDDDWTGWEEDVALTADHLARRIRDT